MTGRVAIRSRRSAASRVTARMTNTPSGSCRLKKEERSSPGRSRMCGERTTMPCTENHQRYYMPSSLPSRYTWSCEKRCASSSRGDEEGVPTTPFRLVRRRRTPRDALPSDTVPTWDDGARGTSRLSQCMAFRYVDVVACIPAPFKGLAYISFQTTSSPLPRHRDSASAASAQCLTLRPTLNRRLGKKSGFKTGIGDSLLPVEFGTARSINGALGSTRKDDGTGLVNKVEQRVDTGEWSRDNASDTKRLFDSVAWHSRTSIPWLKIYPYDTRYS